MENPLLNRFPGVIGFPVSPFSDAGEFDAAAFRENVNFMLDTRLAALAFCGSNGEMQSLTNDEYRELSAIAGEMVGDRKGLIFGVGQTLRTAQAQARAAREAGADAVIIMAPYSPDMNEPGLADYYKAVAETAEVPAFLYQTKWSGVLDLSLLERLADTENICMVKDENGSMSHYLNVRANFGDRFHWVNGMAEPFAPTYWNHGVHTFTSGLACFMPNVTTDIHDLATAGNWDRIKKILDEIVVPLYEIRNRRSGYKCSMIKMGMTLAGLKGGRVRTPLIEMSPEDVDDLKELMTRTGLLAEPVTA
jgi:5-dehydro-4-deoxyglucarate dehydratase